MNPEERNKIIDKYAWRLIDDMDLKTLCQLAAESIVHDFQSENDESVIKRIKHYYPDFFDE